MNRKSIVICGAGDWVGKQYAPIAQGYYGKGEYDVVITYDSDYAERVPGLSSEQRAHYNRTIGDNVASFRNWGATCLDVSKPSAAELIMTVAPHVVFIVTPDESHCVEAARWLRRGARIVIEKPLDTDPARASRLDTLIRASGADERVEAFDHYRSRAALLFDSKGVEGIWKFLQHHIASWRFHMLEPSSDAEVRRRVASIQHGMVMDLAPHALALVAPFGDPKTIRLGAVKAARYAPNGNRGVLTAGKEIFPNGAESFAEVRFEFDSKSKEHVSGVMRIGKFVGDESEKFLEVVGGSGHDRVVRLDFAGHAVYFGDGRHTRRVAELERQPVGRMIHETLRGRASPDVGLFSLEAGHDTTCRVNEFRAPIVARVRAGRPLDEYVAGSSGTAIAEALGPL